MKFNLNKIACWGLSLMTILSAAPVLQGCNDDDEEMKWVDLRYRVEDSYLLEAKNPETISFLVSSTDPWEVFGAYDWHTITPSTGEPGKKYTVEITCQENTGLDDRTDTINIKSDYWTGKKFTITQKGIAYLNIDNLDLIAQEGGEETFDVLSNQKWSAKVTKGDVWLSVTAGASGELDGKITVKATPNSGEQRTGIVTIYDRHGKVAQEVACTQKGVLLTPATPENGKWFVLYEQAQQLEIPVESNAEWTVEKENADDADWYTFEKTSFNGSDKIVVNVSEHKGSKVREGVIVLATKAEEGATPLIKTVRFKQANPKIPVVHEMNKTVKGQEWGPGSLMPGRYNFYIKSFKGNLNLFFIWNESNPYAELRFHVIGGKTNLSTTPWCSDVFGEKGDCVHAVDASKPNVLSFDIQKKVDETNPDKVWIYTEWILNDKVIAKCISDGKNDVSGADDTWKIPFAQIASGGNYMLKANDGAEFTKYEYIAPLDWGE